MACSNGACVLAPRTAWHPIPDAHAFADHDIYASGVGHYVRIGVAGMEDSTEIAAICIRPELSFPIEVVFPLPTSPQDHVHVHTLFRGITGMPCPQCPRCVVDCELP